MKNESVITKFLASEYRFGNWAYYNCKKPFKTIFLSIYKVSNFFTKLITGCEIPCTAKIGKELRLDHNGNGIVIHRNAVMGNNVRIFHQVTIGVNSFASGEQYGPATLGNNVYIGAGAKIIGKINIGNNVVIGAGAIVVNDVPDNSMAIGVPAQIKELQPHIIELLKR